MMLRYIRKQAGVALVTAIFLLVVLAGLAVAIVTLSSTQQNSAAKDELGTQAYLAAKAGLQWALYTAMQAPSGTLKITYLNCATPITFRMPQGTSLANFNVTISCPTTTDASPYGDSSSNDTTAGHFRIVSTACNAAAGVSCPVSNPGPDYVQRVVTGQL